MLGVNVDNVRLIAAQTLSDQALRKKFASASLRAFGSRTDVPARRRPRAWKEHERKEHGEPRLVNPVWPQTCGV
jgi:hypothetical protein